ncbi:MAG: GNAT family N-acetyltransferase [Bacteroidota bacterium]|jgi:RimJ/RimL family protein N-acetyltransferase
MNSPLLDDYKLRELTVEEFYAVYSERESLYFTTSTRDDLDAGLQGEERERIAARRAAFPHAERFQWGIYIGDEIVGWTVAQQSDHDTLLMRNTAIDPAHRGKGLYTALLPIVIEHARSGGYQRIQSTHLAANNAVIVPKLKAGFIITGLNVNEKFGLLVTLTCFLTQGRHHLALNRIGFRD